MNEPNVIWRIFRSILYVFGAGLIISFYNLPNNFAEQSFILQHSLFVWSAAFLHRRPGSTNDLSVVFVAFLYTIFIDEGIALGAIALIVMVSILRKIRSFTIHQVFAIEVIIATAVYMIVICMKNVVLLVFLAPHYTLSQLLILTLSFLLTYPIANILIIVLVRSRKERSLTI